MKNGLIVTILFFIFFQTPVNSEAYDYLDKNYEQDLKVHCENCSEEIELEEEIARFLEQKQIPVSLDECLDIALQNNFDIKARYETYKSAEYIHKNALAKFLPDVGYSFYSIYYRGQVLVGTALIDQFDELALSSLFVAKHDITQGGRQIFEAKVRKFEKYQRKEDLNFTKEEVLKNTAIYYWQLLENKINIEIHIKNLHERIAQLKLTENLEMAGMGTKFDVIRQKNEVANAKRTLINSVNNYKLMQAKLSNVMGIEIQTCLFPVEEEVETLNLVDKNITVDELFKVAENNRKDIKALKDKVMAMKNERRVIYTDFVPKPRVDAQFVQEGTNKIGLGRAVVVGGYVDFMLGENMGVGTITKAKAKTHEINSFSLEITNKLRGIKEDLLNSYYNSKLLLKQIDITKQQVEYATQTVELAEMRLDAGQGILLDVIQAQTFKTNARIEYLQSVIEYNINQVELLFNEGIIDIDKIVNGYKP